MGELGIGHKKPAYLEIKADFKEHYWRGKLGSDSRKSGCKAKQFLFSFLKELMEDFLKRFIYLFDFWLHQVFFAARSFSSCDVQASHCSGFSWLRSTGSVVVAPRLSSAGSVIEAHGLSCPKTCGIFADQGSN